LEEETGFKSALKIQEGIPQPPSVSPYVMTGEGRKKRKKYSVDEYVSGIVSGDRAILSQAITLIESSLPEHYNKAQPILEKCLPFSGNSVRIGITGVAWCRQEYIYRDFRIACREHW
jgi:LAO/AO transport system kinase